MFVELLCHRHVAVTSFLSIRARSEAWNVGKVYEMPFITTYFVIVIFGRMAWGNGSLPSSEEHDRQEAYFF